MKKHFFRLLFVAAISAGLSGCITIHEEITLTKKGSGNMAWRIDMSGLKDIMESFGSGGEEMDSMSYKMDSSFLEMKQKLEAIDGISNIRNKSKPDDMIMEILYEFDNVEALNKALVALQDDDKPGENRLVYKKKIVERITTMQGVGDKDFEEVDPEQLPMMKGFMKDARYEYVLHLPRKVKSVDNEYGTFSGKTVTVSIPMFDLIEQQSKGGSGISLSSKIKMK